ncbi:MAG: hypothetical protein EOO38_29360 [Cytophagaceae bacterium]|nr:MAG: hypothetical protein EOO38_29360 [Cytophagaceae bacterium]
MNPLLFTSIQLRELTLRNRIVVSPMLTYSAQNGFPVDFHTVHYGKLAMGGPGLVIVESNEPPRYHDGRTLDKIIFDGICPAIYPTNKIEMRVLYCVPFKSRSSSSELSLALTSAFRSRKLKLTRD